MRASNHRSFISRFLRRLLPSARAELDEVHRISQIVRPVKPLRDPFSIVSNEMSSLAGSIATLVGSGHPSLNKVANYYFQSQGKHIRPLVVLLLSKAMSEVPAEQRTGHTDSEDVKSLDLRASDMNQSLSPLRILNELPMNPLLNPLSRPQNKFDSQIEGVLPKQRRLAEIVEMIHTASLLHDDVIDNSAERRARPSGNSAFGNKMAILAGDFLLGRASVAIARLRNAEVTELMSTAIANLVEGEFMQLKNTTDAAGDSVKNEYFQYYLHKTYLKTASLMSKSCRSAAVLGGLDRSLVDRAYLFGKNLGLCFQIVDDCLDYTAANDEQLGKPSGTDLKLGLATAPVLYAWETFPELGQLIRRKFKAPGDVELAREYVKKAEGVQKTRNLAVHYHNAALSELDAFPPSDALAGLKSLTHIMLSRSK